LVFELVGGEEERVWVRGDGDVDAGRDPAGGGEFGGFADVCAGVRGVSGVV